MPCCCDSLNWSLFLNEMAIAAVALHARKYKLAPSQSILYEGGISGRSSVRAPMSQAIARRTLKRRRNSRRLTTTSRNGAALKHRCVQGYMARFGSGVTIRTGCAHPIETRLALHFVRTCHSNPSGVSSMAQCGATYPSQWHNRSRIRRQRTAVMSCLRPNTCRSAMGRPETPLVS